MNVVLCVVLPRALIGVEQSARRLTQRSALSVCRVHSHGQTPCTVSNAR
jgi:hypothetical protein